MVANVSLEFVLNLNAVNEWEYFLSLVLNTVDADFPLPTIASGGGHVEIGRIQLSDDDLPEFSITAMAQ